MRVILPNFSFEDALADRHGGRSGALQRVMDSLAPLTGLIGSPDDIVVVSANGIPSESSGLLSHVRYLTADRTLDATAPISGTINVTPWGWDSAARRLAKSLGFVGAVPSANSVRTVNGRRFLADFDQIHEQNGGHFFDGRFGLLCDDITQLQAGINSLAGLEIDRWVAKPDCSAAGRSCMTGHSAVLSQNQRDWLRKQLDSSGYVYLEPWLPVMRECGIQMEISATAPIGADIQLVGIAELITDRTGRYLGSVVSDEVDPLWHPAIDHAALIGRQAAKLGYFGPLGIDCMQVMLPDGRQVLRLCHDINGRLTMGRLALQLQCRMNAGNTGVWLLSIVSDRSEDPGTIRKYPAFKSADIVQVIKVSPGRIGDQPTAVDSWFYETSCLEAARNLVQLIRRHVEMQN